VDTCGNNGALSLAELNSANITGTSIYSLLHILISFLFLFCLSLVTYLFPSFTLSSPLFFFSVGVVPSLFSYSFHRLAAFKVDLTFKNAVFWDVTPCGSCKNRRFGGT
jgi:hypothetical protein